MQSLYAIVNFRGVKQVVSPVVWKICIPPKGADLSLALSNSKLLTRDNLSKRRQVEDRTCLFCNELESIHHLLFECCMAKLVWCMWSEICGVTMGADFESVAKWWVGQKKYSIINVCSASILWSLWKL